MALVMQALMKLLEKDTPSIATPKLGFQPRVHEPNTFSGSRALNAVQSWIRQVEHYLGMSLISQHAYVN